jgi:hypothetical protein
LPPTWARRIDSRAADNTPTSGGCGERRQADHDDVLGGLMSFFMEVLLGKLLAGRTA